MQQVNTAWGKQTIPTLLWEDAFVEVLYEFWEAKGVDTSHEELQVTNLTLLEVNHIVIKVGKDH